MHSAYSDDGEFQPKVLVDLCLDRKIKFFSIADHNCAKGVNEAKAYCRGKNIEIIPAVELDCTFENTDLHVLGYGIDYRSPVFNEIEQNIILQEQTASKKRMESIRKLGIDFSDGVIETLSRNGIVTGEMIAEAAMRFDRNHINPLLKPYYENGYRCDNPYVNFYWDYCSQGKPAYVKVNYISLQKAIKVVEENGGIPVLAHPGNNVKEHSDLLDSIVSCGIKGIEVYSSYHSKKQVSFYKDFAIKHKLLLTCGSDFHGKTKPGISIGCSDCENNEEDIVLSLKRALNFRAAQSKEGKNVRC